MMKYENCLFVKQRFNRREQQQSRHAVLPGLSFFDKALIKRTGKNISHGITSMIEYIIIKGNCKFQSLNMGLNRNAKHKRQQGVIMSAYEASVILLPYLYFLTNP